ncbi:hypothetical protein [Streptomyces sp. NPDC047718]|uniref:hypothetical protein n=1 Tax=Streptomyces sp. NPDC047718 TaxID=3155479 RepID=UPI0033D50383
MDGPGSARPGDGCAPGRATGTLRPEEIELAQALADSAALSLLHWSADPVPAAEVLTKTQAAIAYKNALEIAKGMVAQHAREPARGLAVAARLRGAPHQVSIADTVHGLVARTLDLDRITALPRPCTRGR